MRIRILCLFICFLTAASAQTIHDSIIEGDLARAQSQIRDDPANLELRNGDNLTPLMLAAIEGKTEITRFLIGQNADLTAGDNEGSNALHNACATGHADIVTLLIEAGSDVNVSDARAMSPLLFAALRGHTDCAALLLNAGASINRAGPAGMTALIFAASNGNMDLIRLLFNHGVDVSRESERAFHRTALMEALWGNHTEIAILLMDHGADLNGLDRDGFAPIHHLSAYDIEPMLRFILDEGAHANLPDTLGRTALHHAANNGQSSIAAYLIEQGLDVNATDASQDTPLHGAAWNGDVSILELLADQGAEMNPENSRGYTPMDYALMTGRSEIADLLKDQGARANIDPGKVAEVFHTNGEKTMAQTITATVLYDNYPLVEGMHAEWGFSCLIEGLEKTILFDTGGDAEAFLHNVHQLDVDLEKIDLLIISHNHWDHIGGMMAVLERCPGLPVYIGRSFPYDFARNIEKAGGRVVPVGDPMQICENAYSTGEMGEAIIEHSLLLNTAQGTVIVTGCSHQGIVNILHRGKEVLDQDIDFVFGGFHLMRHSDEQMAEIIREFKSVGVRRCGATHCTGNHQIELFKEAYGENYVPVGVGRKFQF